MIFLHDTKSFFCQLPGVARGMSDTTLAYILMVLSISEGKFGMTFVMVKVLFPIIIIFQNFHIAGLGKSKLILKI